MSFPRIKPLGWAMFEVLTSAQMNQLDIDHAKATDGTYVKDYAAGLSFSTKLDAGVWTRNTALIYIPPANQWVGLDGNGAMLTAGGYVKVDHTSFGAGLVSCTSLAFNGTDILVGVGAPMTFASQEKIRRTTISGSGMLTWTNQLTAAAASLTQLVVGYFPAAGLFITGSLVGNIETSPDGITWTARTKPDFLYRQQMAFSNTLAVMVNFSAGDQYLTSPDGINWTARTFPVASAVGWVGVAYSQLDGMFMAISREGYVVRSSDGINWVQVFPTFSKALYPLGASFGASQVVTSGLHVLGNLWVTMKSGSTAPGVMCSIDQGSTWKLLMSTVGTPQVIAASPGQLGVVDADGLKLSNRFSF